MTATRSVPLNFAAIFCYFVANQIRPHSAYMIFCFARSCESTRPTGSRFAFTTIKSSMLRSLKIFRRLLHSASLPDANRVARHHFASAAATQSAKSRPRHLPPEIPVREHARQFSLRVDHAQTPGLRARHHHQRVLHRQRLACDRVALAAAHDVAHL